MQSNPTRHERQMNQASVGSATAAMKVAMYAMAGRAEPTEAGAVDAAAFGFAGPQQARIDRVAWPCGEGRARGRAADRGCAHHQ